jgi:hypothetical protein
MVIKTSFMKLFNIYYYSLWGFFCRKFCTFSHLNVLCLSVASCTPVQLTLTYKTASQASSMASVKS